MQVKQPTTYTERGWVCEYCTTLGVVACPNGAQLSAMDKVGTWFTVPVIQEAKIINRNSLGGYLLVYEKHFLHHMSL
jgi:hypothetical protein